MFFCLVLRGGRLRLCGRWDLCLLSISRGAEGREEGREESGNVGCRG